MRIRGVSSGRPALRERPPFRLDWVRRAGLLAALAVPFALVGGAGAPAGDAGAPADGVAAGEARAPGTGVRATDALRPTNGGAPTQSRETPEYRGRFVFTRIRYGPQLGRGGFRMGGSAWSHDYPMADDNLSRLLHELTTVPTEITGTNVLVLDDRELFRHPVAYISEPGFWTMSDAEARALREYVLKGGFLIFDDFELRQWDNLEAQLQRVFPEYVPIEIGIDHPIFHSFFEVQEIYFRHPLVNVVPSYHALFEDNDPEKRMLAIINYNNDLAEYWEWSGEGRFPVDPTNEAFKIGINYIVYALTH